MRKILNAISTIIVLAVIAFVAYYFFLGTKTFNDKYGYFEITVPTKINFVENTTTTESEDSDYTLAIYDKATKIYVWGASYQSTDEDMMEFVTTDRDKFVENSEGTDASEVSSYKISDYDAWKYSFNYADNNEVDFYMEVVWIKGEKGIYFLELECPTRSKDKQINTLNKIADTFKEL